MCLVMLLCSISLLVKMKKGMVRNENICMLFIIFWKMIVIGRLVVSMVVIDDSLMVKVIGMFSSRSSVKLL